jgi:hypothetical protein
MKEELVAAMTRIAEGMIGVKIDVLQRKALTGTSGRNMFTALNSLSAHSLISYSYTE